MPLEYFAGPIYDIMCHFAAYCVREGFIVRSSSNALPSKPLSRPCPLPSPRLTSEHNIDFHRLFFPHSRSTLLFTPLLLRSPLWSAASHSQSTRKLVISSLALTCAWLTRLNMKLYQRMQVSVSVQTINFMSNWFWLILTFD